MSLSSYGTYGEDFDEDLTPQQKKWLADAETAQSTGGQIGATAGSILGTAATALIPGAQFLAPIAGPAAGAIGSFIGQSIGGAIGQDSANKYQKSREESLAKLNAKNDKFNRVNQLLGSWNRVTGF